MIFIDASAFCAVLLAEPDADELAMKIRDDPVRITSSIAVYETVLAVSRTLDNNFESARSQVSAFLKATKVEIVVVGTAEQEVALDAFDRYGKGRHPAKLNMGDCFAYACARTRGARLLYKGEDFARTDISAA